MGVLEVYTVYTVLGLLLVASITWGCFWEIFCVLCTHERTHKKNLKAYKARLGELYTMYTEYTKNISAGVPARTCMISKGAKTSKPATEFHPRYPSPIHPKPRPNNPLSSPDRIPPQPGILYHLQPNLQPWTYHPP